MISFLVDFANSELLSEAHCSVQSLQTAHHENISDLYTNTIIVNFRIKGIHFDVDDLEGIV